MRRPCITTGCTRLTTTTRCPDCQRATWRTQSAGRSQRTHYQRGWTGAAQQARAIWLQCIGPVCAGWQRPPHQVDPTTLTVDHLTPRSTADGVTVVCRPCNAAKRDRQVEQLEAWTTIATIQLDGRTVRVRHPGG